MNLLHKLLKVTCKFKLEKHIVEDLGLAFQAVTIFLTYVNLVNDLNVATYVTISRVSWYRTLHIPLPLDRELLLISVIISTLFLRKLKSPLIAILLIIVILSYLIKATLVFPLISALTSLWSCDRKKLKRLIEITSAIVASISITATIRHLAYFVLGDKPFSHPSWLIAEIHLMMLATLQLLSIITYAILPVMPLLDIILKRLKICNRVCFLSYNVSRQASDELLKVLMLISIILSLLYNTAPYLPTVNPLGLPVGVDIVLYETRLNDMMRGRFTEVLYRSSYELLYFLFTYSICQLTKLPPSVIVRLMPLILLPLLAITVYYLALKITKDDFIATLSAFLTVTGPQGTVGTYGSFQANIMALILAYMALTIHFTEFERRAVKLIVLLLCSLIAELLHPWTILHTLLSLTIMGVYERFKDKRLCLSLLMIMLGILSGDIARSLVIQSVRGTSVDVARMHAELLLKNLQTNLINYPRAIYKVVSLYYAGFMNYPLIILVLLTLTCKDSSVKRFTFSWYFTLILTYFTTARFASRIIYNVPISIGISHAIKRLHGINDFIVYVMLIISVSYSTLSLVNLVLHI